MYALAMNLQTGEARVYGSLQRQECSWGRWGEGNLVRVCVVKSDKHPAFVGSGDLLVEYQGFGVADVQEP